MRILLWLFVINLGIAFGAGLYEHRIVGLMAMADSPDAAAAAVRWSNLNYLRHALVLAAWLASLTALTMLERSGIKQEI